MTMQYSPEAKAARMEAVGKLLNGGLLEISSLDGVLASVKLPDPAGHVEGDTLIVRAPEFGNYVQKSGRASAARLTDKDGATVIGGLTVDVAEADVLLDALELKANQIITVPARLRFTHG